MSAQTTTRRVASVEALHEFPSFFHLQPVLVRGEFVESGAEIVLRAAGRSIRLMNPALARGTSVEVRGQMYDVGKLERSDPRLGTYGEQFKTQEWPRPGAEIVLNISSVVDAPPAPTASLRSVALDPFRYEGQTVKVLGNFRGRNLFADLPEAPGKSRYDFVLNSPEGALWVSNMRPRGRGFDLDIDRRLDSGRWLEVTGVVSVYRGLGVLSATQMALAEPPPATAAPAEVVEPPRALEPVEVIFSAPTAEETDVARNSRVRVQFSRGLREATLAGQIRVTYVGDTPTDVPFKSQYDPASRALQITFASPLESYRTVKVELLDAIRAFDDGLFKPWTLTFSVGAQ